MSDAVEGQDAITEALGRVGWSATVPAGPFTPQMLPATHRARATRRGRALLARDLGAPARGSRGRGVLDLLAASNAGDRTAVDRPREPRGSALGLRAILVDSFDGGRTRRPRSGCGARWCRRGRESARAARSRRGARRRGSRSGGGHGSTARRIEWSRWTPRGSRLRGTRRMRTKAGAPLGAPASGVTPRASGLRPPIRASTTSSRADRRRPRRRRRSSLPSASARRAASSARRRASPGPSHRSRP